MDFIDNDIAAHARTEFREPRKTGRKKVNKQDPIGSMNMKWSVIRQVHKLRDTMSGEGPRIPFHEVLRIVVKHYLECVIDGKR